MTILKKNIKMNYTRIKLSKTNYSKLDNASIIKKPSLEELRTIYKKYCDHKKFKSCQYYFKMKSCKIKLWDITIEGKILFYNVKKTR